MRNPHHKIKNCCYFCIVFIAAFMTGTAAALSQDTLKTADSLDYYEMSLEQLLNIKTHGVPSELEKLINSLIAVASKKPLSTRESPAIISLITEDEIKNSGARDLIDALRLVPGIDFGVDVEGVVGIGTRGNWAHEGKMLLLLDGQEMNELLFATNQFGNHFPVEQIKKIEVIRGPGSAIYGGFAEYGVINIITRNGEDCNGVQAAAAYGQMAKTYARRNINLSAGKKFREGEYSFSAFGGQGNRSDRDYTDIYGGNYNMAGNSAVDPFNINLGGSYKGLSFRGIADRYRTTVRDGYDAVKDRPFRENFDTYAGELKYQWKLNDKLSLIPKFNYTRQLPWSTEDADSSETYKKLTWRYRGSLTLSYNLTRKINFILGSEVNSDHAKDLLEGSYFSDGSKYVSYMNTAVFAQGTARHRIANVILGARLDNHSAYGLAFVPRLAVTKKINRFHFKLLYSNAFRAPSIENITYEDSTGLKPEMTQVAELEAGYQLSRKSILTANIFDITTADPIVYYVTEDQADAYHNFGKSGSRGLEMEYRVKDKWGYGIVNYSYYTVAHKPMVSDYAVEGNSSMVLAFPAHKINFSGSFYITPHFSVNPSILYRGERYGYTSADTAGVPVIEWFRPVVLSNLFLRYTDFLTKGLDCGIGVYNLFNKSYSFIQPYNGYHAPLPGPSRELVIKVSYRMNFKNKAE